MKTTKIVVTLAAMMMASLALIPAEASAQINTRRPDWGDRDRGRDYDRGRRNNDWGWDRDRDSRGRSLEALARRTERESNAFRDWFERNYRSRRLGRSQDNRWLKNEIQQLDEAMERTRRRADDRNPDRGRRDFQDAMDHARRIDRELIFDNDRDTRFTNRPWVELRLTMDRLARIWNVRRF